MNTNLKKALKSATMKTFNEIWAEKDRDNPVYLTLKQGLKSYFIGGTEKCYLEDFLAAHGDEPARAIEFHGGNPHGEGAGILFLEGEEERKFWEFLDKEKFLCDWTKIRRRVEDALRKNDDRATLLSVAKMLNVKVS